MEVNDFTLGLLGTIGTSLVTTIGVLWYKLGKNESDKDAIRDKYQEKAEANVKQLTEVMITAANQTNTYTNSISTLTSTIAQYQKDTFALLSDLREKILFGKKE